MENQIFGCGTYDTCKINLRTLKSENSISVCFYTKWRTEKRVYMILQYIKKLWNVRDVLHIQHLLHSTYLQLYDLLSLILQPNLMINSLHVKISYMSTVIKPYLQLLLQMLKSKRLFKTIFHFFEGINHKFLIHKNSGKATFLSHFSYNFKQYSFVTIRSPYRQFFLNPFFSFNLQYILYIVLKAFQMQFVLSFFRTLVIF